MAEENSSTEIHLAGGARIRVNGDIETVAATLHAGRLGAAQPVRRLHEFAVLEGRNGDAVYVDPAQVVYLESARSGVASF